MNLHGRPTEHTRASCIYCIAITSPDVVKRGGPRRWQSTRLSASGKGQNLRHIPRLHPRTPQKAFKADSNSHPASKQPAKLSQVGLELIRGERTGRVAHSAAAVRLKHTGVESGGPARGSMPGSQCIPTGVRMRQIRRVRNALFQQQECS